MGFFSEDVKDVLTKWNKDFCDLLNTDSNLNSTSDVLHCENVDAMLDENISILEVVKSLQSANLK